MNVHHGSKQQSHGDADDKAVTTPYNGTGNQTQIAQNMQHSRR